jgi:hypothetical protein
MCLKLGCTQVRHPSSQHKQILTIAGVALRMAEDLGVHEDHLPPVSTGSSGTPSVDFESRRRMSLTLSISDKFPPFLVQWQTSLTQVLESSVSLSEGHP